MDDRDYSIAHTARFAAGVSTADAWQELMSRTIVRAKNTVFKKAVCHDSLFAMRTPPISPYPTVD